jgi:hypothetical protein
MEDQERRASTPQWFDQRFSAVREIGVRIADPLPDDPVVLVERI